jgi:hypothetical protein
MADSEIEEQARLCLVRSVLYHPAIRGSRNPRRPRGGPAVRMQGVYH